MERGIASLEYLGAAILVPVCNRLSARCSYSSVLRVGALFLPFGKNENGATQFGQHRLYSAAHLPSARRIAYDQPWAALATSAAKSSFSTTMPSPTSMRTNPVISAPASLAAASTVRSGLTTNA